MGANTGPAATESDSNPPAPGRDCPVKARFAGHNGMAVLRSSKVNIDRGATGRPDRDAFETTLQLASVLIGQNVRRTATNLLAWER